MTILETCPNCLSDVKCYEQGNGEAHGRCPECGRYVYLALHYTGEDAKKPTYIARIFQKTLDYLKGEMASETVYENEFDTAEEANAEIARRIKPHQWSEVSVRNADGTEGWL